MLKIPGANGAIVKCVDGGNHPELIEGENYHVNSVVVSGGGNAFLNVTRNGKLIEMISANSFVNLEKLK